MGKILKALGITPFPRDEEVLNALDKEKWQTDIHIIRTINKKREQQNILPLKDSSILSAFLANNKDQVSYILLDLMCKKIVEEKTCNYLTVEEMSLSDDPLLSDAQTIHRFRRKIGGRVFSVFRKK